ncbi:hypothetical protein HMPREF0973_02319 [Prevotella veroralis F0319]|uniref:Lipoprotein n=1 Tax=Prevotella veroralis F0319 TaxID=649761 RepID=C9MRQ6_9BACT|nr:hypothetical protein HMPREF0973_02319 [Prevotella veroralis F0319]
MDRKNYLNRLSLGAPLLGGGCEGFPDEGVCPYLCSVFKRKKYVYFNPVHYIFCDKDAQTQYLFIMFSVIKMCTFNI